MPFSLMVGLAPVVIGFEIAQLFVAHRYIGPAQIRRNLHPLDAPVTPPFWLSVGWMCGVWGDYIYQGTLVLEHNIYVRLAALLMLAISLVGFVVRRACGLKWGLVVMTLEAALRIGFMVFAFGVLGFDPNYAPKFYLHP
jgi:hypothetical protein